MEKSPEDIMLKILQVWLNESDQTLKSLYAVGVAHIRKSINTAQKNTVEAFLDQETVKARSE